MKPYSHLYAVIRTKTQNDLFYCILIDEGIVISVFWNIIFGDIYPYLEQFISIYISFFPEAKIL